MIPFRMKMGEIFTVCPSQRFLAKQNQLRQAFILDRFYPALRKRIQIRAACMLSHADAPARVGYHCAVGYYPLFDRITCIRDSPWHSLCGYNPSLALPPQFHRLAQRGRHTAGVVDYWHPPRSNTIRAKPGLPGGFWLPFGFAGSDVGAAEQVAVDATARLAPPPPPPVVHWVSYPLVVLAGSTLPAPPPPAPQPPPPPPPASSWPSPP